MNEREIGAACFWFKDENTVIPITKIEDITELPPTRFEDEEDNNSESFVMYKEWSPLILAMSCKEAGELIKAISYYQTGRPVPPLSENVNEVFEMMKARFIEDDKE